ncbi:hypothetical protein HKX48_000671 [Thoreauomyces humboldtii]|nr:hypothetical protein HKX48_000671 [Thoreauomyces humboldtii]
MAATKDDYLQFVQSEETEIYIISLVEHVVQKSQEVLFEKHIESQVLPYALQFAKGALDEMVEWEFFRQDPGVIDPETWEPDEEPEPATIDSWAPGAIPIRKKVVQSLAKPSAPSLPSLSNTSSLTSIVSDAYVERLEAPIITRRPSSVHVQNIRSSMTSLSSSKKQNASRMELQSTLSLSASNASLRGRRHIGSAGSSGRRSALPKEPSAPAPLSAAQIAETAIQEENKRALARLHGQEKDNGKPLEWSYDHNGRIVPVKKLPAAKQTAQGKNSASATCILATT